MAFNPTPMQEKAIKESGNILVSAAAGSGKTAVLVERVIYLIKEKGINVDKLLIVTFTNAAAAEMRSRIEKRIHEEIQATDDAEQLERLQEQKYLLQKADICTIDSFCINLVRKNFEKCGVQPDFAVGDLSQQVDICTKVMSALLDEYLKNPTKDFTHLLELTGCEYDAANLTDIIKKLYEHSQLLTSPDNFIKNLSQPYETVFDKGHPWYDMAFDVAKNRLQAAKKTAQILKSISPNENYEECAEKIIKKINDLDNALSKKDWDGFLNEYGELTKFPSSPSLSKKDPEYEKKKKDHEKFRDTKSEITALLREKIKPLFRPRNDIQNELNNDCSAVKLLVEMVIKYKERLFEALQAKNEYTFSDIEQMAFNLICEEKDGEFVIRDEAKDLCEYYYEVLVDEFQDVNNLQDELFNKLSNNEEKLFVVGDVKQSIYGFRGSNPENFLLKKNRYIDIAEAQETDSKKIILSDNFRSHSCVCNAVNFFFSKLLAGQCSDIIYDEHEYLNAHDENFLENHVVATDVLLIDKSNDVLESTDEFSEDETLEETKPLSEKTEKVECDRLELEARRVAEYIRSVMNEGNIISDEITEDENGNRIEKQRILRKAQYKDFAVLLATVSGKADKFVDALDELGIPVALGGDAFMTSREISTVMSLLQVIDNPRRDVQLLDVMMSSVGAFDAEEIAQIKINYKSDSLYSSVIMCSSNSDGSTAELTQKALNFIQKLSKLRREAAVLSVDRLISRIIHSDDILNIMSSLDGGNIRRANLFSLIKYAKEFEARYDSGIYGFIRYMNALPESSFKGVNTSGENAVKIMSMHGSKGLQFPVCIVANLGGEFNKDDYSSSILFKENKGIAFRYYNEATKEETESIGRIILSDSARAKNIEERLRLLYVAMTRAIDKLCVVCSDNNLNKKLQNLAEQIDDDAAAPNINAAFLRNSTNMAAWILSCALIHPDGKDLRDRVSAKLEPVADVSRLNIILSNSKTFSKTVDDSDSHKLNSGSDDKNLKDKNEIINQIKENTEWTYPYEELRRLQAKASVSRLVHSAEDDRYAFESKPAFMLGEKLAGAARGSAMHHVMQYINFAEHVDVAAEIERLVESKYITKQEANSVDTAAISAFFDSDVYKRIKRSGDKYRREMRFLSEIPANQIDSTVTASANIIVQGAVDLCFEEDDGVVVLDFKTDRVKDMSELVKTYGEQLEIYSMAAKKIFGKPVKENIIYSFHLGKSISF